MRGFFTFAKSFISFSSVKTQQMKVSIRLVNQSINCQLRLSSTLTALRMANLYGIWQKSSMQEVDDESELDIHISQLMSLSLKAEQQTIQTNI
ncbi:unnamed protein product (macronuclear) [Paramecium tetraurelia]|uniref:Uncharacterized protein n=1 Tax=Paramecium tetraurelia TaxID=5888 RepID=A0CNE6_PARTE|nr:uncharacterized protein GSPATT00008755001 [Paramecium tetraurelia]CAK72313.1 unnamed protein product [Paramecium tetraurelia]|eukprot:XP_001439710.1 hypothetical protein (macronuclear) [Paramecium tetraurelia strain d4-2]